MKKTLLTFLSICCLSSIAYSQITFSKTLINGTTGANPYVIDSGYLSYEDFDPDPVDVEYYNDIVIGTDGGNTIEYYKNLEGTFGTAPVTPVLLNMPPGTELTCVEGIEIADINNDGFNDVIATGYCNDRLVWFRNNGDGTFADAVLISTTSSLDGPGTVISANLDNDVNGYIDLVISVYGTSGATDSVIFLIGDGTGGFTSEGFVVPEAAGLGPADVDLADFDGDGDIDAVVGFQTTAEVIIYNNELVSDGGAVSFLPYMNVVDDVNGSVFSVNFGDVNNDDQLDVVVVDNNPGANPRVAWYPPTFSAMTPLDPKDDTTFPDENIVATANSRPARAIVANMNDIDITDDMVGDTFNDLVISNGTTAPFDITWRRGNNMAPPNEFDTEEPVDATQQSVYSITINDFNNDNILDIASVSYLTNSVMWFLNDGNTLSVEENTIDTINEISIYPNPVKDKLHFKGTFNSDLEVSVYDVLGKRVINNSVKYGQSLNVSKLNNGIYIIKFKGFDSTFKFVKN